MKVAAPTPLAEAVSVEDAREELSRFFVIADLADRAPEMFSHFIDAQWHALLENPAGYEEFCFVSVGHSVGHTNDKGQGTPSWLDLYHERFGTLPAAWFASAKGIVDVEAYERYLDRRTTVTAWDCTPTTGDPDYRKTQPTDPLPPVPDEAA